LAVATPYAEKTDEQRAITEMVRQFVDGEVLPIAEEYDHEDKFPEAVVEQMKELGLFGVTIPEEYGGMGLDLTTYAMIVEELSRGWISISGIVNTHFIGSYLLMKFGTDEQKQKYLPRMATGEVRAAFSLSEPELGSDVAAMACSARRDGDHYILNGSKCWIGNASIADVKVVWARDDDGHVGGFVVEKDAPGFRARDIEGKFSLRMSRTSECWFENCRIPVENRLPNASGLRAPLSCLSYARVGIAWGVIGAAIDCYETALAYAKSREQFGRPIASFQLVQQKLVWMAQEITKAQLLALRLTRLMEAGSSRSAQISMAKRNNVWVALQCARKARDILGAAGITDQHSAIRHLMNLESVFTYEGTHDIHTLIIGRDITGLNSFGA